jgi:hypothetical protein
MSLKLALQFAEQSFAIFPMKLKWDQHQQRWRKNPLVKNNWQDRATTDANRIRSSWHYWSRELAKETGAELVPGLPLGRCGLVVVDCDRHANAPDGVAALRELGPLPPHPVITTRSGGQHHYYRQPAQLITKTQAWRPGIDIIGAAGCVVGYAVPQEPIPMLPAAFSFSRYHTHLGVTAQGADDRVGDGTVTPRVCVSTGKVTQYERNYAWQAVSNAWNELRRWPKGSRNARLNKLGYKLGGLIARGWVARNKVEFWLLRACEECGLIADDGVEQCRATLASGIDAGMRWPYPNVEPNGAVAQNSQWIGPSVRVITFCMSL